MSLRGENAVDVSWNGTSAALVARIPPALSFFSMEIERIHFGANASVSIEMTGQRPSQISIESCTFRDAMGSRPLFLSTRGNVTLNDVIVSSNHGGGGVEIQGIDIPFRRHIFFFFLLSFSLSLCNFHFEFQLMLASMDMFAFSAESQDNLESFAFQDHNFLEIYWRRIQVVDYSSWRREQLSMWSIRRFQTILSEEWERIWVPDKALRLRASLNAEDVAGVEWQFFRVSEPQ